MPKTIRYTIQKRENGLPLKSVLAKSLQLSRREISRLKFSKGLLVNDEFARVTQCVNTNDVVTLIFPEYDLAKATIVSGKPEILFEDEDLVIVNKPSGMPCHPSTRHQNDDMGTLLTSYYHQAFPIRAIGRLDKDVSGLMIYAKNQLIAARLSSLRQQGKLTKQYLAICHGTFTNPKDTLVYTIDKQIGRHQRFISEEGKTCITEYKLLHQKKNIALIQLHIVTGRTHQIRVGMQSIDHTLVGDTLYGSNDTRIHRPSLHCYYLDFIQPLTKQPIHIEIPLPKDMQTLWDSED